MTQLPPFALHNCNNNSKLTLNDVGLLKYIKITKVLHFLNLELNNCFGH